MNNKLRGFREEKKMSQEQLSELSGVSRTIISGIESGRVKVTTTATLKKLAIALNKTVSEIFFD